MSGEDDRGRRSQAGPTELEDIGTIFGYLGLDASSAAAQRILGLTQSQISDVVTGRGVRDPSTRRHIATVAAVIERLAAARAASTGSRYRIAPADVWLELAAVETSQGLRTPVEILADRELCNEVLRELTR